MKALFKENSIPNNSRPRDPVADYAIKALLLLFPLFYVRTANGLSEKDVFFFFAALVIALRTAYIYAKERVLLHFLSNRNFQICFAVFLTALCLFVYQALTTAATAYHTAMYLCMFLLLFCGVVIGKRDREYLLYLNASLTPVYLCLYYEILTGKTSFIGAGYLLENTQAFASLMLLGYATGALLFATEPVESVGVYFAATAVAASGLLFLRGDALSFCLAGLFVMTLPAWKDATARTVRRAMLLALLLAFTASNAPLLLYAARAQNDGAVRLEYSLYIDVALAAAGLLVTRYRERTPEADQTDDATLSHFVAGFRYARYFTGAFLLFCYFFADRIAALQKMPGVETLQTFTRSLSRSVDVSTGEWLYVLQHYGVIGFAVLCALAVVLFLHVRRRLPEMNDDDMLWVYLSGLFAVQSVFYPLSMSSLPLYAVFLTFLVAGCAAPLKAEEQKPAGVDRQSKEAYARWRLRETYARLTLVVFCALALALVEALSALTISRIVVGASAPAGVPSMTDTLRASQPHVKGEQILRVQYEPEPAEAVRVSISNGDYRIYDPDAYYEETNGRVTTDFIGVNLRTAPSIEAEGRIVGELPAGGVAERTAVGDNGWSRLIYDGQTVYAVTAFLREVDAE